MLRNEKGQFAPGNKGGPGRPKKDREERYYQIAKSAVPYSQFRRAIKKLAQLAERGDLTAMRLMLEYLVGKPGQRIDITSAGEKLPGAIIYLPEVDELETESGPTGEVSS